MHTDISQYNPAEVRTLLETCQPALDDFDWSFLGETPFLFVGAGALNRPLAMNLAFLGMKRAVVVDPKSYKLQSIVSQCKPEEVGQQKATVVCDELAALGVNATSFVEDIENVPPGYVEPDCVLIVGVDNRRADIIANRLAIRMRARLVKVNVEPRYLVASIRSYDFRMDDLQVCVECQFNDQHYANQRHPLSCDGGGSQTSTGSPRALSQFAAGAASLAIAQIVCSPEKWGNSWTGRQWQQMLLGGGVACSQLSPNSDCRCDHHDHWENLHRQTPSAAEITLADLMKTCGCHADDEAQIRFSTRVALQARCEACHHDRELIGWVSSLEREVGTCSCGGSLRPMPFFTHHELSAVKLQPVWEQPLRSWGVPENAILAVRSSSVVRSFVV